MSIFVYLQELHWKELTQVNDCAIYFGQYNFQVELVFGDRFYG